MRLSPKTSLVAAISFGAFALIAGTGLTVSSAWLITSASQHPPIMILGVAIVMVRFFGIARSASRYVERVISHEAIFGKLTRIRVDLFNSIASRLRELNVSRAVKQIIDDVERAQEFYLRITLPQYAAILSTATTLLLGWWINSKLLLVLAPLTVIFGLLIPQLTKKWVDPIAIEIEDYENNLAALISDASHAVVEAEHFGYGVQYRTSLAQASKKISALEARFFSRIASLQLLATLSLGAGLLGVAVIAAGSEEFRPVHVSMAIFLALVGFEGYTTWFPNLFIAGKVRRASQNIEQLSSEVINVDVKVGEPNGYDLHIANLIPYWEQKFLSPINLELPFGQTLVISGPSGVGKSTTAAALLQLTSYEGEIEIGGVELSHLPPGVIAGTLQVSHIFNTSLRENLKIANQDASDEELRATLALLELDSLDLDERLGEFGRPLSGGEAKRVAIARALLAKAPITILDEPLEHLDHQLALRIQGAITSATAGRSLIVITHAPWLQYSRKLELARE